MKKFVQFSIIFLGTSLCISLAVRGLLSAVSEPLRQTLWNGLHIAIPIISIGLILMLLTSIFLKPQFDKRRYFWMATLAILGCLTTWGASLIGIEYPAKLSNSTPTLNIRVPMDGKVVVAWGGDDVRKNYHAAYPDQRWAYDLVVEPHSLRSTNLSDYGCFGKTVLAPISGEIKTAHDGESDRIPDENAEPPENVYGNYIVMQPDGQDTRLIIAHLKQDSLKVKRGDRVEEGKPIAECGNSGNTTEPHVHIHLVALHKHGENVILTGLPLYFKNNEGPKMPMGGFQQINGLSVASGDIIKHEHQR